MKLKKYLSQIHGENFYGIIDDTGNPKSFGFYKTIIVECTSVAEIEKQSVIMIRKNDKLNAISIKDGNPKTPMVYIEKYRELDESENDMVDPGFIFYNM